MNIKCAGLPHEHESCAVNRLLAILKRNGVRPARPHESGEWMSVTGVAGDEIYLLCVRID